MFDIKYYNNLCSEIEKKRIEKENNEKIISEYEHKIEQYNKKLEIYHDKIEILENKFLKNKISQLQEELYKCCDEQDKCYDEYMDCLKKYHTFNTEHFKLFEDYIQLLEKQSDYYNKYPTEVKQIEAKKELNVQNKKLKEQETEKDIDYEDITTIKTHKKEPRKKQRHKNRKRK
ncbi:MAG: hypothetical protein LUG12_05860 [Erysipelotrichaceae bacterium]|nr:hypothetical protein [Erysipelotrichaceae bacterium]